MPDFDYHWKQYPSVVAFELWTPKLEPLSLRYRKKYQGAAGKFVKIPYFITGQQFLGRQVVDCFAVLVFHAGYFIGRPVFLDLERSTVANNNFGFDR